MVYTVTSLSTACCFNCAANSIVLTACYYFGNIVYAMEWHSGLDVFMFLLTLAALVTVADSDEKQCSEEGQCTSAVYDQEPHEFDIRDHATLEDFSFHCHDTHELGCKKFQVCDGYSDCGNNRDESISNCARYHCLDGRFRCDDDKCIPRYKVCDGKNDCSGKEDEEPAACLRKTCKAEWKQTFKCDDGRCIESAAFCDGTRHCKDGSDEPDGCSAAEFAECEDNQFRCSASKCIDANLVCDMKDDCVPDGRDEDVTLCGGVHFKDLVVTSRGKEVCEKRHMHTFEICDKVALCEDKDEAKKRYADFKACREDEDGFLCNKHMDEKEAMCIHWTWVCDGVRNCQGGEDELKQACVYRKSKKNTELQTLMNRPECPV